jgi:hypothetical protein
VDVIIALSHGGMEKGKDGRLGVSAEMVFWQPSLHEAAQQYADQRQSKCEHRYCNRTHAIPHINTSELSAEAVSKPSTSVAIMAIATLISPGRRGSNDA